MSPIHKLLDILETLAVGISRPVREAVILFLVMLVGVVAILKAV